MGSGIALSPSCRRDARKQLCLPTPRHWVSPSVFKRLTSPLHPPCAQPSGLDPAPWPPHRLFDRRVRHQTGAGILRCLEMIDAIRSVRAPERLRLPASPPPRFPAYHHAFSTLHTKALPSWMLTLGSPTSEVSVFTTSPFTTPSHPQCHGMPTW